MAPPTNTRKEGASSPSNDNPSSTTKVKRRDTRETLIVGDIDIDELFETITIEEHPYDHDGPLVVDGTSYTGFETLLESAVQDTAVADSLTGLIHCGNLAMAHRQNLVNILSSIRDGLFKLQRETERVSKEQVLELREELLASKEELLASREEVMVWKAKYLQVRNPEIESQLPSQPRYEEPPQVEEVSSRPVRKRPTTLADTSDCDKVAKPKKHRKPMKNPEMLSDGKIVTFEAWELKMKNKLEHDHEDYGTEEEKIAFIFSCTTGKASDVLLPYIQPGPFRIVTANAAFKALSACFKDCHRKLKARAAFKKLRLREGGDYYTFHTEFVKLALVSRVGLNSYKVEFAERLPRSIRMLLLGPEQDDKVDFDEYQVLASQIANAEALLDEQDY